MSIILKSLEARLTRGVSDWAEKPQGSRSNKGELSRRTYALGRNGKGERTAAAVIVGTTTPRRKGKGRKKRKGG